MAPMAVRAQRALVHVDNIDSAAAAELADALAGVPMLVTGRYAELRRAWDRCGLGLDAVRVTRRSISWETVRGAASRRRSRSRAS